MSEDDLARVKALYRIVDENDGGAVEKSISASRSALHIFEQNPAFADSNWDLFYDGFKKINAICSYCNWEPSADVLTEWTTFEVQLSSRIAGKEAR